MVIRFRKVWPLFLAAAFAWTLWQLRFLFRHLGTMTASGGVLPLSHLWNTTASDSTDRKCPAGSALRPRHEPSIKLVDTKGGLRIMSAPKGGASLMAQLFFRRLGLLEQAQDHNNFIHIYRNKWLSENPEERAECRKVCHMKNWTCVQLIRSPLDRAVSSYIHTMRTQIRRHFPELQAHQKEQQTTVDDASFDDFLRALRRRAAVDIPPHRRIQSRMDDHFMPQSEVICHMSLPHMYYVPIEAIHPSLEQLERRTGVHLNATGLTSGHYVKKRTPMTDQVIQDVAKVPFPSLKVNKGGVSLPYEAYLQNADVNRLLCSLFCHDIALYRDACTATWLSLAAQNICDAELERINQVCGAA